jgi:hypothetical protein
VERRRDGEPVVAGGLAVADLDEVRAPAALPRVETPLDARARGEREGVGARVGEEPIVAEEVGVRELRQTDRLSGGVAVTSGF